VNVAFNVNGVPLSYSDEFAHAIPAGGMALICANKGVAGSNRWVADALGVFGIVCTVDPNNVIAETREDNNILSTEGNVFSAPLANLALHRPVTVSSIEGPGLEGANAVDGNMTTRWSSAFSDPQSITVDLSSVYSVSDVSLYWETAYARAYVVMTSTNGQDYHQAYAETAGDGGLDVIPLSENARYVRVIGVLRATQWGYSLYEFQVHGSPMGTGVSERDNYLPEQVTLYDNYPNPFNPTTHIGYALPHASRMSLRVYDRLGREVVTLVDAHVSAGFHTAILDASSLASGVYFYRLEAGSFSQTKRLVVLK
jgi:hypothetical protein